MREFGCTTCSIPSNVFCEERPLALHTRVQNSSDTVDGLLSDTSTTPLSSLGTQRWELPFTDSSFHPIASYKGRRYISTSFHVSSPSSVLFLVFVFNSAFGIAPSRQRAKASPSSASLHRTFRHPSRPSPHLFCSLFLALVCIHRHVHDPLRHAVSSTIVVSFIHPLEKKLPVAHGAHGVGTSQRVAISRRIGSDGDGDSDGDGASARVRRLVGRAVDERRRMDASQLGNCGRERSRRGRTSGPREHGTGRT